MSYIQHRTRMAQSAPWHIYQVVELCSVPLSVYSSSLLHAVRQREAACFTNGITKVEKQRWSPFVECGVCCSTACEILPLRAYTSISPPWTLMRVSGFCTVRRQLLWLIAKQRSLLHTPALLFLLALMHPATEESQESSLEWQVFANKLRSFGCKSSIQIKWIKQVKLDTY